MQNNKLIYLIITKGCEACRIMTDIMRAVLYELNNGTLVIRDVSEIPMFIKTNVPLNDFPTLVLVKNKVIKYHTNGTMTKDKVKTILSDTGFR